MTHVSGPADESPEREREALRGARAALPDSTTQENLADAEQRERIKNLEQERRLRRSYATKWFWVVIAQLAVIYSLFGVWLWHCQLDEWTVRVFFGATILQTFGVILAITRHLFHPYK